MTSFAHIPAVFVNPVVLALLTGSLGIGASLAQPKDFTMRAPAMSAPALPEPSSAPNGSTELSANSNETSTLGEAQEAGSEGPRPAPLPQLTQAEQTLARRVSDALRGKSRKRSEVVRDQIKAAEAPTRYWVCGEWEDLIQGRGQARSCEWR